ncbi:MAG: hypothetical protein IPM82_32160 [Saprospiraceae bacterium]|nr:hypothetical protein [Saprospiraceae bacterium]
MDDVESAIKQIHEAKTPTTAPAKKEPTKLKKPVATKKAVESKPVALPAKSRREVVEEATIRKVRLSVDINPATHKRLKIKAIEQDSDIMHYVEMLIERDLAK